MGHEVLWVFLTSYDECSGKKEKRLKTIQENFSNEYSLDEHISTLNWVGFRKVVNLYVYS